MAQITENKTHYAQRELMARRLSDAYDWDFNTLMLMHWDMLFDVYEDRYVNYTLGAGT